MSRTPGQSVMLHGKEAKRYACTISALRALARATIQDMAYATGFNYHTIIRIEAGKVCSTRVLVAVADALLLNLETFDEFANYLYGSADLTLERQAYFATYIKALSRKGLKYARNSSSNSPNNTSSIGSKTSSDATGNVNASTSTQVR